jgi:hypothetical protein
VTSLQISLYQPDDGDRLARFRILASNDVFSGATLVWGYAESFSEMATVLDDFPHASTSKVTYKLGSPGTGFCNLEFSCIDGLGHAVVWVTLESEYPVHPSADHQRVKLCIHVEPTAIDKFCMELKSFAREDIKEAALYGS